MKYVHLEEIHNTKAAHEVVPILIELFSPKSVIDIGCGTGSWLKVFEDNGVKDFIGLDGDYLSKEKLVISSDKFLEADLEKPIALNRRYDMLVCLEVAEHLSKEVSQQFIRDLTQLSSTIVFSAAIPHQGGQNHLNEQYPDYWISYFNEQNYEAYDLIRPLIWNNENVDWWYRQNIIVFIHKSLQPNLSPTSTINPLISHDLYNHKITQIQNLELELRKIKNAESGIKFYWNNLSRALHKRFIKSTKK